MSEDSYTEVTSQSWFGRLGDALKGIIFGLILLVVGVGLLFWNEGRAVRTAKALEEGAGVVITVKPTPVEQANEGKLVHVSGNAESEGALEDSYLGVRTGGLKLLRKVEMYQWEEDQRSETRKKVGGGEETVTTYTYKKTWSSSLISSNSFKKPSGHENPDSMPVESETFIAPTITVGDFTLSPGLVSEIDNSKKLPLSKLPQTLADEGIGELHNGGLFFAETATSSPASPQVGDVRVFYSVVPSGPVSLVAQQAGNSFAPYTTSGGQDIELLQTGTLNAQQMFAHAQQQNTILTWVLRAVGVLCLFIGFTLLLRPLSVAMDVIPLFGNVMEMGVGLVSILAALIIGLIVVAVAWLFYRPLLGGGLLAAAVALFVVLRRKRAQTMPPPAPVMSAPSASGGPGAPPPPPR